MAYVSSKGVQIHYQVEGSGPPLVLLHGSFGSLDDWRDFGYVAALRADRTLILMDARGHGKSGRPLEPQEYALALRANDVVAVLDDLGISRADYVGYSMGAWIGYGLARHAPARFRSLVLGGAHPFYENMESFRALIPDDAASLVEKLKPVYGEYLGTAMQQRVVTNDCAALRALMGDREDQSDVLAKIQNPCLLFAGSLDPRSPLVEATAKRIPGAEFFRCPDCRHVAAWGRSELVLPKLVAFLSEIETQQ